MQTTKKTQPISVDPEKALQELRWLALAAASDTTRVVLCRVWADSKRAVATDGHRLHFVEGPVLPNGFAVTAADLDIVLALHKNYPLLGLDVEDGATVWHFACGDLRFAHADNRAPDYEQVLPRQQDGREVATTDLRKTIVRPSDEMEISVIGQPDSKAGHFNARYVTDALRNAPKRVDVYGPADDTSPVLFRYGNRGAVVMPVRQ